MAEIFTFLVVIGTFSLAYGALKLAERLDRDELDEHFESAANLLS